MIKELAPKSGREFALRGVLAVGATIGFLSFENLHLPRYSQEELDESHRIVLAASHTWAYVHNGAAISEFLPLYIDSGATSIEVDVMWDEGKLRVAHDKFMVAADRASFWNSRTTNYFDSAVGSITDAGKDIHFDIKLRAKPQDQAAVSMREVVAQIPKDRTVTISGERENWELVSSIRAARENSIGLFSIKNKKDLEKFWKFYEENDLQGRIGVSIKDSVLDEDAFAEFQKEGLLIVVWTVNSPGRAAELARWEVFGITTDRIDILNTLGKP